MLMSKTQTNKSIRNVVQKFRLCLLKKLEEILNKLINSINKTCFYKN